MELLVEYPYWLVPLIFLARVADVSLATFRTIVVFRGRKLLASVIGFFEIIIWLAAAAQVLNNIDQWYLALAYAVVLPWGTMSALRLKTTLQLAMS